MIVKAIKTSEKLRGNKYGKIYKHSKVDRYYSVQVNDKIICENWFHTLNGARLAMELVCLGLTEDQINFINCDDIGHVKYLHINNPKAIGLNVSQRLKLVAEELYEKLIKEIDLRSLMYDVKHYTRLIMQELFNEYRKFGDLDRIDSFLCDHYSIERFFKENPKGWTYRWVFDKSWTNWESPEIPVFHDHSLLVSYQPEENLIQIYKEEKYEN